MERRGFSPPNSREIRYRQLYDRQYNFETDVYVNPGEELAPVET